jgi:hypothetical protein
MVFRQWRHRMTNLEFTATASAWWFAITQLWFLVGLWDWPMQSTYSWTEKDAGDIVECHLYTLFEVHAIRLYKLCLAIQARYSGLKVFIYVHRQLGRSFLYFSVCHVCVTHLHVPIGCRPLQKHWSFWYRCIKYALFQNVVLSLLLYTYIQHLVC